MKPSTAAPLHPCYDEAAQHHYSRMHVAVAPRCNLRCHYCNPKFDCANESRPGVASRVLKPEEALEFVGRATQRLPSLRVVGIAGPGDPLANPEETFRTLRLLSSVYPNLELCLSTNGLVLPEYVEELVKIGVRHVTVTANTLDPAIAAQLYAGISYEGKAYRGAEAGQILIDRQWEGIRRLIRRNVRVKVNSVFVPELGCEGILEVSKRAKEYGAFTHNILPLLLSPGSRFQRLGVRTPSNEELLHVQEASSEILPVMRHCRQCRADAVGLLGEDVGAELDLLPVLSHDAGDVLPEWHLPTATAPPCGMGTQDGAPSTKPVRIAVATRGSGVINQHFGHAKEFLVYEVLGQTLRFLGVRKISNAYCSGTSACEEKSSRGSHGTDLEDSLSQVRDCELLLCSGIGSAPAEKLRRAGLIPLVRKGEITEQLIESARLYRYFTAT